MKLFWRWVGRGACWVSVAMGLLSLGFFPLSFAEIRHRMLFALVAYALAMATTLIGSFGAGCVSDRLHQATSLGSSLVGLCVLAMLWTQLSGFVMLAHLAGTVLLLDLL